jgi:hypothetical protein
MHHVRRDKGWLMKNCFLAACAMSLAVLCGSVMAQDVHKVELQIGPSPVDNPLKGLVPYQGLHRGQFPHSMEFNYVGLADLVKDKGVYDWTPMERLLDDIASRGHQAIFRIYLEYPGKKDVIPKFLIDGGLKVHRYLNTNTQPLPPAEIETPDYENELLRQTLKDFIAAMGAKYDGDPRVAFITAGLLGTWGEWHTYPRNELFASKAVQAEVIDAYDGAFKTTPVLLRYPADGKGTSAANVDRPFGYHDDSFAWSTLDTGRKGDDWFYMTQLKATGGLDKWKREPIGGEIRPEAWGKVFAEKVDDPQVQNFDECVAQTHVSWLMDSGMFRRKVDEATVERAKTAVRRMGYDFHVPAAQWSLDSQRRQLSLTVQGKNIGLAPFYYPWKVQIGLLDANGKLAKTYETAHRIDGILPQAEVSWDEKIDLTGLAAGQYCIVLRVPNSLKNGHPVRFANQTQDQDLEGWLSIGKFAF